MTPSAIIPQSVLSAPISAWARLVWGQLAFHRNRTTGQCNPRYFTLARELGTSEDTIGRAVAELRRVRLVTTQKHAHHASSYELSTEPVENHSEKPVENQRSSQNVRPQIPRSRDRKFQGHATANSKVTGPASLYEPELFNLNSRTDAAVSSEGLRKPASAAAAAMPLASQESPNANAAAPPPQEITQQLELMWDQPGLKPQVDCQVAGSSCEPPAVGEALAPVRASNAERVRTGPSENGTEKRDTTLRAQAEALVEELHAIHPQPGLPDKAVGEAARILAASEDLEATVELIRRNHASWRAHWEMFRPGQFIPQLWRWFRDGEWKRAVGKPVRQETWYQRQDRLKSESQSEEHILQPLFDAEMEEWRAKQRRFNCA